MVVYEDILSNEKAEQVTLDKLVHFKFGEKLIAPILLNVSYRYTPEKFEELILEVTLANLDEINTFFHLVVSSGYTFDELKALVFSHEQIVKLSWRAKPKALDAFNEQLVKIKSLDDIWKIKSPKTKELVFLNLSKAYQFMKVQTQHR